MPKKFDKKNAVHFHVVHRSQRDPHLGDADASPMVLRPANEAAAEYVDRQRYGDDVRQAFDVTEDDYDRKAFEIGHLGLPDDGYDYSKHLKEIDGSGTFVPGTTKESKQAAAIIFGAAPEDHASYQEATSSGGGLTRGVDLDIAVALENADDAGLEEMEDDFIAQLMVPGDDDDEGEYGDDAYGYGGYREPQPYGEHGDWASDGYESEDEDGKPAYAESAWSMRSVDARLVDEKFEKVMEEYEEQEDEEHDGEPVGQLQLDEIDDVLDDFLATLAETKQEYVQDPEMIARVRARMAVEEEHETDEKPDSHLDTVEVEEDAKWDCETILTTYTNVENHPTRIPVMTRKQIRLNRRGIASDYLERKPVAQGRLAKGERADGSAEGEGEGEDEDEDEESEEFDDEVVNKGVARAKTETPEERKARKAAVKEERRQARERKKALKGAYKQEEAKQKKQRGTKGKGVRL